MPSNNRIFIAFAAEDSTLRDFLVGQARNEQSPFSFVDMSVKQPWDNNWKTNCRTKIKGCDGLIAIITGYTAKADGQLWEIACALQEGVPVLLIKPDSVTLPSLMPTPVAGRSIKAWTWTNIKTFLNKL